MFEKFKKKKALKKAENKFVGDNPLFTRRKFIQDTGSLILAGFLGGLGKVVYDRREKEFSKSDKIEDIFGTLDNPKYEINKELVGNFRSFEDYLNDSYSSLQNLNELDKKLSDLENKIEHYTERVPEALKNYDSELEKQNKILSDLIEKYEFDEAYERCLNSDNRPEYNKILNDVTIQNEYLENKKILFDFYKIGSLNKEISNIIDSLQNNNKFFLGDIKEGEKRYGSLEDYANDIFKKLTGKDIPSSLNIDLDNIQENKYQGIHKFLENKICYKDLGFEASLIVLMHELGHAIYQGGEKEYKTNLVYYPLHNVFADKGNECSVIEEAAAYLTEINSYNLIDDLNIKNRVENFIEFDRYNWIGAYKEGSDDCHAVGWAMAESLGNYFKGDYAKALRFLKGKNQFSDLPKEVFNYMDKMKNFLITPKDYKANVDKIGCNLDRVLNKYSSFSEQYKLPKAKESKKIDWAPLMKEE